MTTVFLTGGSGYIGGQVLKELVHHPRDYTIRALIRNEEAAKRVSQAYPRIQIVRGSLDDIEIVEDEASKATVVLNLASNKHVESVKAIHRGLAKQNSPVYWVQVSGASVLAAGELASASFQPGSASYHIYDDVQDAERIRSLIRAHPTRTIDNYLCYVAQNHHPTIRIAIVFPPIVYGLGEGPMNKESIQIPALVRVALEKGHVVRVGQGLSCWGNVHVRDIAKIFSELADAGANGCKDDQVWGRNGIYLPSAGELSFGDISEKIARVGKEMGLLPSAKVIELSTNEADTELPHGSVLFGTNARLRSNRAEKELGWKPVGESLEAEIARLMSEQGSNKQ